jgi:hypothetical protein
MVTSLEHANLEHSKRWIVEAEYKGSLTAFKVPVFRKSRHFEKDIIRRGLPVA